MMILFFFALLMKFILPLCVFPGGFLSFPPETGPHSEQH